MLLCILFKQNTSQGHTHTHNTPCLQDRIEQIAGQGHTHNTPCLQDRIEQIASQGHTQHTLPTRLH